MLAAWHRRKPLSETDLVTHRAPPATVLDGFRPRKSSSQRLAAGGRRIRTLSPTLMTRNSDRLIEFDGAGSHIGRSPFRPILVER
jgi:hypothetical protein